MPEPWFGADALGPARTEVSWPAAGVAVLEGARLLQQAGYPVGADDTYLGEFMQRGLADDSAVFTVARARRRVRWPGRTLHLGNVSAPHNYYHWLIDAAGKAAVFLEAGLRWTEVDRVFLPHLDTPATRCLRAAIGVPEERIVTLAHDEQAACDEVWLPTMPAPDRIAPAWLAAWWRERLPVTTTTAGGARVFLRRDGKRSPRDPEGLERRLTAHGFEVVDPADFDRVRARLAEASHLVGVHGAGLANLLWARPGSRVLEIAPATHVLPFYRGLAAAVGLDYGALVVPAGSGPEARFDVPTPALERALTALLQDSNPA